MKKEAGKTILDYVEEADEAYKKGILALTKEQIMLEAFRMTVWDEVVDYFNDYHDDDAVSEEELALFATHNVVKDMYERLLRNYEIPTTETIYETYGQVIYEYISNLNPTAI